MGGDLYRVRIPDSEVADAKAIVTLTLQSARSKQVLVNCDSCEPGYGHIAAALDHLLEAKSVLGLAAPPDESVPLEHLTEEELHDRAVTDRQRRAEEEPMTVRATDKERPWSDYLITSGLSGKTYRVALRGTEPGVSYCSCPDFRSNGLGICKHILHALSNIEKRFSAAKLRAPYYRENVSLRLDYHRPVGLRFNSPTRPDETVLEIVQNADSETLTDAGEALLRIRALNLQSANTVINVDLPWNPAVLELQESQRWQSKMRTSVCDSCEGRL